MLIAPNRLVFVAGLHRSGTTELSKTLGAHAEISAMRDAPSPMNEGQHLQDVYPIDMVYGGPGRFALDHRSHLDDASPLVSATSAARMLIAWVPFWDVSKRLLVEKSPPNLVRTRFLQALYPGARFVVIVRHPIVAALAYRKWNPHEPLQTMVRNNIVALDRWARDRPRVEHAHEVRYEALVAQPRPVLAGVAEFLGLGSPIHPGHFGRGFTRRYQARWAEMARGTRAERHEWRRAIEAAAPWCHANGYDPVTLEPTGLDPGPLIAM